MPVEPEKDVLRDFRAQADEPFVMLNLLRFHPDGRDAYAEYSRRMRPLMARYGLDVIYAGDTAPALVDGSATAWDAVLLVRYPDRSAFLAMIDDPDYLEITTLRTSALVEAVLQPTTPW